MRVLKGLKRTVASVLGTALIFTSVGVPPLEARAAVSYTDEQVFCAWLRASGIDVADGVSPHDYGLLYANLTTSTNFVTDKSLAGSLDNLIEDAKTTGKIKVSATGLRTGMREWVKSLYSSSKSALPSSLGLQETYKYTEEYAAVSKYYADSYDFITPTNGYDGSASGHDRITGVQTIDLARPQWLGVNLTSGTLAADKSVSVTNALKLFGYDEDLAFAADAAEIQKNEAEGFYSKTDATATEHPGSHFQGTKHVHTGNSLTGSGCYNKPVYHVHDEGCYEESYAMIASSTVTVYRTVAGNGYQLDFTSDTASFPFMRVYTSTSGSYNNYYKTYDGKKVSVTGNVTNVFTGDGALDAFKGIALRCVQIGTSTTYKYDVTWSALWDEFSSQLFQVGYTATLCPAYSRSLLATCGQVEGSTVLGYELGCGLEEGKYYDDSLHEVFDTAATVVSKAELLHPMQRVTKGNEVDTRVKFTFLDGHTETVNAVESKKLAYLSIESTYDASAPKTGRVYPYKVTATAKYGNTVLEAAAAGMASKAFTLLVSDQDTFNASSDETKKVEDAGRNDEVIAATGHKHGDACYPGEKHKHTVAGAEHVVYHTHSVENCGYDWKGDTEDLRVRMTLVGSVVTAIYYSKTAMYKVGFDINLDTGHVGMGSSSNVADVLAFPDWNDAYSHLTGTGLADTWNLYSAVFHDLTDSDAVDVGYSEFVNSVFGHHPSMTDAITCLGDSSLSIENKRLNERPNPPAMLGRIE